MKVAVLISRAGPTNAALFKRLNDFKEIDLEVLFFSDIGIKGKDFDGQFGKSISWREGALEGYSYKFLKNWLPNSFSSKNGFWLNPGIVREILWGRYDFILIYGWNSITHWLAFVTAIFKGVPFAVYGENPLSHEVYRNTLKIKLKKIILGYLFKRARFVFYVGQENKEFIEFYGAKKEKEYFVPYVANNDIALKEYSKRREYKNDLRIREGINKDKKVILFVGRLIDKKNPLDLIAVFKNIIEKNKNLKEEAELVIVGDGPLMKKVEEESKYDTNIKLVGFKNKKEIWDFYGLADIFVLPSGLGETWGIVVNEAMCFGLPIIVSDLVGSGRDLVREGENGFIFKTGNRTELEKYLTELLENDKKRLLYGKKSLEIIDKYSPQVASEAILKAIKLLN